ncbi:serine/threonine-protein kinase pim-3-like isoform X4 [Triplophysa dalaica]|uniref:serine/threonine-protein kinase pim-3-like isoform X4 n=1 Tax=Triplophysa dalaica TaxID=1582913 RepID=UPI0024DFF7A2|nr:serine/threonine-protein kinase pim-3-like isoform X4 [Triplophysa dalaica]
MEARSTDCRAGSSRLNTNVQNQLTSSQPAPLFSSCYELGSSLGSGSYGLVCDGIRKSDGLEVAIKHVPLQDITYVDTSKGEHLPKEVALQQELHKSETCPYIVKIYDWYLEDQLIMTMEYPRPCMTLHDFIKCHPSLPRETLARRLMTQAVMAAKYWIGHGVNHDSAYAVADTVCGLGNILALLVGCCCFTGVTHKHIVSEECHDLINRSICRDPADRLTLDEFSDHEWFVLEEGQK